MRILGIETSCDDTSIAILEVNEACPERSRRVLANIVSSQIEVHKKWGGVYPTLAKREHQKNLVPVLVKVLKEAKMLSKNPNDKILISNKKPNLKIKKILEREDLLFNKLEKFFEKYKKPEACAERSRGIDLIAVTEGPGLDPCLWVGINFAKALSYYWNIPVVAVNHVESHILANLLNKEIKFPAVCLIVSGGHTQLILAKEIGDYKVIGETRDDAAGECFDKTAKILGLGYPGGPIISELAEKAKGNYIKLPRPMINTNDYDFSFSGLKTAVLYNVKNKFKQAPLRSAVSRTTAGRKYIFEMSFEIQQSIIDVLIKKTLKAANDFKANTIILGGGVSANKELRKQFETAVSSLRTKRSNLEVIFPDKELSTDNAVMTAITGYFHRKETKPWQELESKPNLRI